MTVASAEALPSMLSVNLKVPALAGVSFALPDPALSTVMLCQSLPPPGSPSAARVMALLL